MLITALHRDKNFVCAQEHGLKFHLRKVSAFTPLKGKKGGGTEPSSLTLGLDMAANQCQIAQFSRKDAEVCFVGESRVL